MITPVITSGMGGQPGTSTTGLSVMTSVIGTDFVGLGLAACTQPQAAHEPQPITALALAQTCLILLRKISPPGMQNTPSSPNGMLPSTATMYWPLYFSMVSSSAASAC